MFKLPYVPTAKILTNKTFRRGSRDAKRKKATSPQISREMRGKRAEEVRVKTISSIIIRDLNAIIKHFPSYDQLPPFYQELLDVKIDKDRYKKSLGAVQWCANNIKILRNKTLKKIKHTEKTEKAEISKLSNEFMGRCASFLRQISSDLDSLIKIRGMLINFPEIQKQPTLVISGFPNVGKSTFLRTLTGSKVKIAAYPFTTQEIGIGHHDGIKLKYFKHQIIDTPGLLDRPMEYRNATELQAILAMKHLTDVLVFIIDPIENIDGQFSLLYEIKNKFSGSPMIVAINKIDLIENKKKLDEIQNRLNEFKVIQMCANDYESVLNVFTEAEKLFTDLDKYKY